MVPRAAMLATKNRAGAKLASFLAIAILLSACAPPGPRALLKGKKLLESGNASAAVAELQQATGLMPTNAAAWNYLGVAYHRSGQWTNAAVAYSQALRFNRDLLEVRFNLGCLALDQDNPEAAKAELFTYTSRRANDGPGWVKLGTAQLRTRDLAAAEKSFREALRIDGKDVLALNGLGMVLAQNNRSRDAVDVFLIALHQQPDFRPALLNLATVLLQQNDRAGALQRYREYLSLQPRDGDWNAVSAIVNSLEPAVVAPNPAAPANQVAPPAAVNNARSAVESPPHPTPSLKSESPTTTGKSANVPVPAVKVASSSVPPAPEIVKLSPEPVIKVKLEEKPSTLAPPVERKGFFSKLNPFRREAKAAPSTGAVETNLQSASPEPDVVKGGRYGYVRPAVPPAGDRKAAERELAQGQEAQRARRMSEAIQHYRRAVSADGSYFEAHYALGRALFETRSFKASCAEWETALAIQPDFSDARYNFAFTLKAAGQYRDAAAELEKLLALHPDEARAHLTLGNLYAEQLGDKPRARLHYNRVLELEPRNPQAQAIRYWLVANPG